ncbi:MAG: TonB-dependent siderophore receptor [Candidatus Pedobacter colombiensis]|uniref:TonB-dependent siderophore receptor n=1 Tax=Candidatus Pedobacter colombiensis TaxID=3121371 RepID=A0AAJ5WCP4_9SPHI|nr:TonB-dependent siderophore receptor [Pedobacter sp.]WEK20277.1 MAG: TonB-dependent siderophore receptor [Pedobacter sp.]
MKYIYAFFIIITLFLFDQRTFAQQGPSQLASASVRGGIKGKIRANDGKPASFVTVQIVENNRKTLSDEEGKFRFNNLKGGEYTLKTSYVGLKVQTQKITVIEGQTAYVEFVLSETSGQLDEVVIGGYQTPNQKPVSLGKIAIAPRDLPQSVQIIGTQIIEDQQANRLADVIKNVNGVSLGANRGSVGENFYARGYSLGANNVLKNGARTTIGGMPEASTLESVEVLKGSSALLYGGVSGGAVVNMVTKKPKFEYGGEVSMRVGSYDFYKPTLDLYGPVSKNLAVRVIGTYEKAGSFRDNVKSERIYVNPSLLYQISDKTDLLIQGDYLKSDYTPDFGIGTIDNKISPLGRNVFVNTDWAYNKTNTSTAQAVLNHKFNNDWKLNVSTSLQSYDRNYFSSERPFVKADGIWNRALTRSKINELTFNEQINLTGTFKTGTLAHTLLVGADADQSRTKTGGFSNPNTLTAADKSKYYDQVNLLDLSSFNIPSNFNAPETTLLTNTEAPIYRVGGFVQDMVAVSEKLKVLAGIRWTFQKTPTTTIKTPADGTETKGTTADKTDKAFSPKVGIVYEPLKATSIYASYASNFTPNAGTDVATNAPMRPSIIDQYEAGIKNDFLDGKLSANVTWYKIVNNRFAQTAELNLQGVPNGDTNLKEFTGKSASDGIEVDISGTIIEGLNFIAGYSYNYMRYTSTSDTRIYIDPNTNKETIISGIVEGERLVGTTKNTANGSLFYTFSSGAIKGLKLGASAFYTGDRNGGRNTTKAGTSTGIIPIKGFTTFDLSAGYAYKKFSILGKLSNITNELNYYIHENYSVNPIPPRQFMTTVAYKF